MRWIVRTPFVLITGAVACSLTPVLSGASSAVPRRAAPATHQVRIVVRPRLVVPYASAVIDVGGVADASAVDVRLKGASGVRGTLLPWVPLQRRREIWSARLPQPILAGIYPIELRTRPRLSITPVATVYLRVYWAGTDKHPLFPTPEQAAGWWVRHVTDGTLVAIRRWPGSAIDHRVARLHRLFVVAYSPPGRPLPADRLGVWITAVREGGQGMWRVLEASETPP
jgi:hypothetical protein